MYQNITIQLNIICDGVAQEVLQEYHQIAHDDDISLSEDIASQFLANAGDVLEDCLQSRHNTLIEQHRNEIKSKRTFSNFSTARPQVVVAVASDATNTDSSTPDAPAPVSVAAPAPRNTFSSFKSGTPATATSASPDLRTTLLAAQSDEFLRETINKYSLPEVAKALVAHDYAEIHGDSIVLGAYNYSYDVTLTGWESPFGTEGEDALSWINELITRVFRFNTFELRAFYLKLATWLVQH